MNFDFKKWFPVYLACTAFFVGVFLMGCSEVRKDSLAIRNWEQGVYSTAEVICTDLSLHQSTGKGHTYYWQFTFADGTTAAIPEDARYGFDEEYFRSIMHRPLVYVYAEPSGALMDIREGNASLLDTDYSGKNLYNQRTSSLFFALLMSPLALIYVVIFMVEAVKYFKKKKEQN